MSPALIFALSWGAMVVASLVLAHRDERSRRASAFGRDEQSSALTGTSRRGRCVANTSLRRPLTTRDTGRRWNADPVNPSRL